MRALVAFISLSSACSTDAIDSDEAARRAYLGLDGSVEKSITLGFAGFDDATSANIPAEQDIGDAAGTLQVTGQVDQGSSANKGMRLDIDLVGYSDGPFEIDADHHTWTLTYDTDATAPPALDMMLKGIPTGTITGTLVGTYHLSGDLAGDVDLDLTIAGTLADDNGIVTRAPGTTITGTATQGDGVYNVTVTL